MSALKLPELATQSYSLKLCSDRIALMGFCVLFSGGIFGAVTGLS